MREEELEQVTTCAQISFGSFVVVILIAAAKYRRRYCYWYRNLLSLILFGDGISILDDKRVAAAPSFVYAFYQAQP